MVRRVPRPGKPVRGSKTGRPIMALFDLLGRRWLLRVLWELRPGPHTFRSLQAACDDVSPTVLATRLADLRAASLVELTTSGYALTPIGTSLLDSLDSLNAWAATWARQTAR